MNTPPNGVIFYDNGKEVPRVDWPDFPAAQVVWLTTLNGCGRGDEKNLPGETVFDCFRYHARDWPGANILPNGGFEYNQDKVPSDQPVAWQLAGTPGTALVLKGMPPATVSNCLSARTPDPAMSPPSSMRWAI